MKTRIRWMTMLLFAALCLSSCTGRPAHSEAAAQAEAAGVQESAQTLPAPVAQAQEPVKTEPAPEEPAKEASVPEEPVEFFTGGITLWAGSDTALVNSKPVQIPAAPFVENGIFFFPLQFIAETLGWEYQYESGVVQLQSSLLWTTLSVGERTLCADGKKAVVTGTYRRFVPGSPEATAADDTYVPVVRDGVVFLPLEFLSTRTDNDTRSQFSFRAQMFPEDGYVIISGHGKENGIGGFYVWDKYDQLPQPLRDGMDELGVVSVSRDDYDVVEYGSNGLFVHVLRLRDGCEDEWQLDGYISAVYTTNPDIPTPRGLRVGEDISRIETTYDSNFYMQLLCITEDDVITKIRFFSYYDADNTIQRQPQTLYMDATEAGGLPSSE